MFILWWQNVLAAAGVGRVGGRGSWASRVDNRCTPEFVVTGDTGLHGRGLPRQKRGKSWGDEN